MRSKQSYCLIIAILAFLYSCDKQAFTPIEQHPITPECEKLHVISVDDALTALYAFLGVQSEEQTKSLSANKNVSVIKFQDIPSSSRSSIRIANSDKLVYLVNFGEEEGYAILAADDRIEDDVIAIVNEGSITVDEMLDSYNDNFSTEYTTLTEEEHLSRMLHRMCLDYATKQVSRVDSLNMGGDVIEKVEAHCQIVIRDSISPLLTAEEEWSQGSPFNNFCPTLSNGEKADAGCVPLAVSKIFAYFECPAYVNYNNVTVNWNELKTNYNSTIGSLSAAALLRFTGIGCNSLYFSGGTFTLPSNAKSFMEDCFFDNVSLDDYSTNSVISMLDDGCPLFICSLPHYGFLNYDFANSHAWNIDGYKTTQRITTYYVFINGVFDHIETVYGTVNTKVHCDFGWKRKHNGYYTSGIFQLNGYGIEYDDPTLDRPYNDNFNSYLKIITYNSPL